LWPVTAARLNLAKYHELRNATGSKLPSWVNTCSLISL
jgi:hypothetical protein